MRERLRREGLARVWIVMRLALVLLLCPALTAADPARDELPPLPPRTVELGATMHTSKLAGLTESGTGVRLGLAMARGCWQGFVEASHAWVTVGPEGSVIDGTQRRGAVGLRWLARSFELERAGAFDLMFEAFAGVQRFAWQAAMARPLRRPEIGAGVGFADRLFVGRHQLALHLIARVTFAPIERDDVAPVCRGSCVMPRVASNSGITANMGVSWW